MIKTNEQIETDKLLLSCTGLWEEFRINKTKDPINVQEYYNLISNLLDQQLNHSRMWLSSPHAKEYYYAEMQRQKEILQSLDREWDDLLEQTYESVDDLIERVYELGKQKGYNDIKEKLVFTDTDKEALDFVRQYNFHLIKKLSDDLRSSVKNNITQAVATGENPYSLANKIVELGVKPLEGSTLSAKQRAVMIAKTEVSRAQNTGILQSYVNEGYTEVTILTAEDADVCTLCLDNAYLFNKSEDKVYHPGLKDNVHRISDLDEGSMLPLHPNCRCTYLSVWESKLDTIENKVINLTPLSNLKDKIKSKLNGNPTTLEQTAKYFGLEYYGLEKQHPWSGNRGKYHKFYDKENDCTFYISENICKGRNKCISLNNDGSSYYDLKEVLQMYNDAPLIMKQKTTSISFVNRNNGNALGRHMSYKKFSEEEWNSLKDIMGKQDDYVEIFRCCLQVPKNAPDNLQTSLYHEMGHSVDLSKNGGVNLSSNPRYKSAVDKEGFSSWYSEDHFTKIKNKYHKKDLREDVAETISIVSFKNINKDNAKIKLSDGSILTYDEFIVKYPEKVKLAEEALGI